MARCVFLSSTVRSSTGLFVFIACLFALAGSAAAQSTRNVILIIGDGMDDQQITIARNYLEGSRGVLSLDRLPVRSVAQVLTVSNEDPEQAIYVADSANTATSMATGVATSRGRISTTAGSDEDIKTIIERAEEAGFATGIVATASVTDATPASFAAHVSQRFCENPGQMSNIEYRGRVIGDCSQDLKANGGPGSISEQLVASGVDVILGGGAKHFEPMAEGEERSVKEVAAANGYRVVVDKAGLESAPGGGKLLGLFAPGHLPVMWQGEDGRVAEKPKPSFMNRIHKYLGKVKLPKPMTCVPNPAFEDTPSLAGMTDVALARLSQASDRGFFLIIESASIDKKSHGRDPCGSIGELEQLDRTVDRALAFAERHPETLILVTADHGHAAQIIPNESLFSRFGVPVYTPGHLARLKTPEGSIMGVNYATNDFKLEEHSGVNVPLYANQAGVGRVPPMITQPEVYDIMVGYLGLRRMVAEYEAP
ncbi:MAG: alkaline phosphatase [Myxococcota bacterium]|jgi:alkaline phosphatase|nr:alkaline phosphatase [Myxococcota bacterium]